ncbi:MAG: hypothetical protein V4727_05820 [Verrucomicrobiota bacterium]
MLRKTSLLLNALVVVLSLSLMGYTFFAKSHLVEHTWGFVTEKTLAHSKPMVGILRAGLNSPLSQKLITEERRAVIEGELKLYDTNPIEYVTQLTSAKKSSFGTGKIAEFKESVQEYYQSTLDELVRDLRIFAGSNCVAGVFAMCLLLSKGFSQNHKVVAFSFLVFVAVAYSTYSYVEGVSFMRILFKSHLGWWYPASIFIMILGLVLDHGLHKKDEKSDEYRAG